MIISFFRDNAPLIAFLALLLGLANFLFTYLRDKEQTRRWNSLNLARLVIKNLRLDTWREIPRESFSRLDWGYKDPLIVIRRTDDGVMKADTGNVAASVIAVKEDFSIVDGTNAITLQELITQLQPRGLDPNTTHFMKLYRVTFEVENTGATAAFDLTVQPRVREISDVHSEKKPQSGQTLQPGESTWTSVNLKFELDEPFSDQMHIDVFLSFSDMNRQKYQFTHSFIFERSTATFRRA